MTHVSALLLLQLTFNTIFMKITMIVNYISLPPLLNLRKIVHSDTRSKLTLLIIIANTIHHHRHRYNHPRNRYHLYHCHTALASSSSSQHQASFHVLSRMRARAAVIYNVVALMRCQNIFTRHTKHDIVLHFSTFLAYWRCFL